MDRAATKFVLRIPTADQKQQRVDVCTEIRQLASEDETLWRAVPFLFRSFYNDNDIWERSSY
jgi:hypothetical protein